MGPSEKIELLRSAPWTNVEALRAYTDASTPASLAELRGMVDVLREHADEADGPRHKNRCTAFRTIALGSIEPGLFVVLAEALADVDPLARATFVAVLPRANDVDAHHVLCRHLGSTSADVRAAAATVLAQVGGPSALAALERLAGKPEFAGRVEALRVMVPKAHHRATGLVAAVLRAGTVAEQRLAIELIGDPAVVRGEPQAILPCLRLALRSASPEVVEAAFRGMIALLSEDDALAEVDPALARGDAPIAIVSALGAFRGARALEALLTALRGRDSSQRLAAVQGLRQRGLPDVIGPLVDAACGAEAALRRVATEALTELARDGRTELAPVVIALLRRKDPAARRVAVEVMRSFPVASGELAARVLTMLRREEWIVRERVLDGLVELGVPALGPAFVALLEDPSPVVRRYAVYGLLRLRDRATLGAMLLVAARDEDWWVREQALLAAGALGAEEAVPYVEALLVERPDLRVAAIECLGSLGAHDTLLAHADRVSDEDPAVRAAMLRALETIPDAERAGFHVQAASGDAVASIARAAHALLARWKLAPSEVASSTVGLLDRLLVVAARRGADDVILHSGAPPQAKRHGAVEPLGRTPLSELDLQAMLLGPAPEGARARLAAGSDADFTYEVPGFGISYRVNLFRGATGLAAVMRRIVSKVPDLAGLGLPASIARFVDLRHGLVLITGPTGSGKTTTLGALIDIISRHEPRHVITVEDPVEIVHTSARSIVNQREVGRHAASFGDALRGILRQDPDVILIGELRDAATADFALRAAETGHLVFATLHTTSAAASVDRFVHLFSGRRQGLVRSMLADTLEAVCCQQLLQRIDGRPGRAVAAEILFNVDASASLIRKDKAFQLEAVIATNRELGMVSMDSELERLVLGKVVAVDEALTKATDKAAFAAVLARAGLLSTDTADAIRTSTRPVTRSNPPPPSPGATTSYLPPRPSAPPRKP